MSYKKIIFGIFIITALLCLSVSAQTIVSQDFETDTISDLQKSPYTLTNVAGLAIRSDTEGGSKYLRLTNTTTTGIRYTPDKNYSSENVVIEFKIRGSSQDGYGYLCLKGTGTTGLIIKFNRTNDICFMSSNGVERNGGKLQTDGSYSIVKLVINYKTNTYNAYINGEIKVTDFELPDEAKGELEFLSFSLNTTAQSQYMDLDYFRLINADSLSVETTLPRDNAKEVDSKTDKITIKFDSDMMDTTLIPANFKLKNKKTDEYISYTEYEKNAEQGSFTIILPGRLEGFTNYELTILKEVKSYYGYNLTEDEIINFTTGQPYYFEAQPPVFKINGAEIGTISAGNITAARAIRNLSASPREITMYAVLRKYGSLLQISSDTILIGAGSEETFNLSLSLPNMEGNPSIDLYIWDKSPSSVARVDVFNFKDAYVKGINLSIPPALFTDGQADALTNGVYSDGTTMDISGLTIKYSSDNELVAKISESGKITAIRSGSANITAEVMISGIKMTDTRSISVIASRLNTIADVGTVRWKAASGNDGASSIMYTRSGWENLSAVDEASGRFDTMNERCVNLKFDIDGLSSELFTTAKLRLYGVLTSTGVSPVPTEVMPYVFFDSNCDDSWTEDSLSWNTRPAAVDFIGGSPAPSANDFDMIPIGVCETGFVGTNSWVEIDITDFLKSIAGTRSNLSVVIWNKKPEGNVGYQGVNFQSRETGAAAGTMPHILLSN